MRKELIIMLVLLSFLVSGYTAPNYDDVEIEIGPTYIPPLYDDVELEIGAPGAEAPPADSCTYTSGDWNIDCSDNCLISSVVNVGKNNINIVGTGSFTMTANVENYAQLKIIGTDSSNTCIIKCTEGCFQ